MLNIMSRYRDGQNVQLRISLLYDCKERGKIVALAVIVTSLIDLSPKVMAFVDMQLV